MAQKTVEARSATIVRGQDRETTANAVSFNGEVTVQEGSETSRKIVAALEQPLLFERAVLLRGLGAHLVDVKVDRYRRALVRDFMLAGVLDTAAREGRDRIEAALMNSGFGFRQAGELSAVKPSGSTAATKTRRGHHRRDAPRSHRSNLLRPQAL